MAFLYSLPTDNRAPAATKTLNPGTADSGYPVTNIADLDPGKPFKATTSGPIGVVFNFGSAQQVDVVFVPMHNFAAGLDVRWQMNTADSWGSPPLDAPVVIAAYGDDGLPAGAMVDLTAITPRTYQYGRLFVPTNTATVAIGEVWIAGTKRALERNLHRGATTADEHLTIQHRTPLGSTLGYRHRVRLRRLQGEFRSSSDVTALVALYRATDGDYAPFMVARDATEAFLVRWPKGFVLKPERDPDVDTVDVEFLEVARGKPL